MACARSSSQRPPPPNPFPSRLPSRFLGDVLEPTRDTWGPRQVHRGVGADSKPGHRRHHGDMVAPVVSTGRRAGRGRRNADAGLAMGPGQPRLLVALGRDQKGSRPRQPWSRVPRRRAVPVASESARLAPVGPGRRLPLRAGERPGTDHGKMASDLSHSCPMHGDSSSESASTP